MIPSLNTFIYFSEHPFTLLSTPDLFDKPTTPILNTSPLSDRQLTSFYKVLKDEIKNNAM